MNLIKSNLFLLLLLLVGLTRAQGESVDYQDAVKNETGLVYQGSFTLVGPLNLLHDYQSKNKDGSINAVIEIPSGTNSKWEVKLPHGQFEWDLKDGQPRVVEYLAYPLNYGMVPQTILSNDIGGDGDPLDILVLGPSLPRGQVAKVKVIGLMKMIDKKQKDDKLIAVPLSGSFTILNDMSELIEKFPGITDILKIWFERYKGTNKIQVLGFDNRQAGLELLEKATQAYQQRK